MLPPVDAARRGSPPRCSRDDDPSQHDRPRPDPGRRWAPLDPGDLAGLPPDVTIALLVADRPRRERGQALVETALVLPIILSMGLGFVEAGFLVADKADLDRRTAEAAQWAARHPSEAPGPSWAAVVDVLLPGCDVTIGSVDPDLVTVGATCHYTPTVTPAFWSGLPVSSEATAAVVAP